MSSKQGINKSINTFAQKFIRLDLNNVENFYIALKHQTVDLTQLQENSGSIFIRLSKLSLSAIENFIKHAFQDLDMKSFGSLVNAIVYTESSSICCMLLVYCITFFDKSSAAIFLQCKTRTPSNITSNMIDYFVDVLNAGLNETTDENIHTYVKILLELFYYSLPKARTMLERLDLILYCFIALKTGSIPYDIRKKTTWKESYIFTVCRNSTDWSPLTDEAIYRDKVVSQQDHAIKTIDIRGHISTSSESSIKIVKT